MKWKGKKRFFIFHFFFSTQKWSNSSYHLSRSIAKTSIIIHSHFILSQPLTLCNIFYYVNLFFFSSRQFQSISIQIPIKNISFTGELNWAKVKYICMEYDDDDYGEAGVIRLMGREREEDIESYLLCGAPNSSALSLFILFIL